MNTNSIAIIGAGAAGCFCAINIKQRNPDADVHIFESAGKALAKVAITGGGRCNLTNTFNEVRNLKDVYPRGDKLMRRALNNFSHEDTWEWFEREGVRLVAQDDECVFPQSQDAMEIVTTLLRLINHLGIHLHLHAKVTHLRHDSESGYIVTHKNGNGNATETEEHFNSVVVTTGGHPTPSGFAMLDDLELKIEQPVPSLFTFNVPAEWNSELMGTVVEDVCMQIAGTKLRSRGPLLLTHWGMSGPAVLKLSSHGARLLAENSYHCNIIINWFGEEKEDSVRQVIASMMKNDGQKLVTNVYPRHLTARHWAVLLQRSAIPHTQRWGALNAKMINKLVNTLTADTYEVTGKCAFKEEFVTCGGVSLSEINMNTMESKRHPGLFFAGEVLDIDAVTGGFNLQAAWSTAFAVSEGIVHSS